MPARALRRSGLTCPRTSVRGQLDHALANATGHQGAHRSALCRTTYSTPFDHESEPGALAVKGLTINRWMLRWPTPQRLTPSQRREVIRLQGVQRDQRRVLDEILALLQELAANTIDRQVAKSDVQLGLEYLLSFGPPLSPRRPRQLTRRQPARGAEPPQLFLPVASGGPDQSVE
jgi:hypothetical protein